MHSDGTIEEISWDHLTGFDIETNELGPFAPDVFWVLRSPERAIRVPQGATGDDHLLERLQQLPGFDNEAFIPAMASTEEAVFKVWRRKEDTESGPREWLAPGSHTTLHTAPYRAVPIRLGLLARNEERSRWLSYRELLVPLTQAGSEAPLTLRCATPCVAFIVASPMNATHDSIVKSDRRGRLRYTKDQKSARVEAYQSSGLSGPRFAGIHGVKVQTLASWLQKRETSAVPAALPQPRPISNFLSLIPAGIDHGNPAAPASALPIHLPGGIRLDLTATSQAPRAAALIRQLQTPPSCGHSPAASKSSSPSSLATCAAASTASMTPSPIYSARTRKAVPFSHPGEHWRSPYRQLDEPSGAR
jgi:transposase-like protein